MSCWISSHFIKYVHGPLKGSLINQVPRQKINNNIKETYWNNTLTSRNGLLSFVDCSSYESLKLWLLVSITGEKFWEFWNKKYFLISFVCHLLFAVGQFKPTYYSLRNSWFLLWSGTSFLTWFIIFTRYLYSSSLWLSNIRRGRSSVHVI